MTLNETRKDAIERVMKIIHTDCMVVDGKLPTERRLSELTGLNRLSLREALIAMEGMGILDIRNRQGIYLNESQGEELVYLMESAPIWMPSEMLARAMEMRQILDPAAAALAAARRGDRDIEKLNECLTNMREIRTRGGEKEAESGAYWNSVLHSSIFKAAGNALLLRAHDGLGSIIEKGVAAMRTQMPEIDPEWREMILAEHGKIVGAIVAADPREARRQMERHIGHTMESMRSLGQLAVDAGLAEGVLS